MNYCHINWIKDEWLNLPHGKKAFLNNSLIISILNKLFFIINTINECIRHWLSMSNSNIKSWNINIYIYIYIVCSKVVKLKVGTNIDVLIHW